MSALGTGQLVELVKAAAAVAGQPDLKATLQTTVEMARQATGARYAALGVLDRYAPQLVDFLYDGMDEETAARIGSPPSGRGVLGTLIRHPATIRIDDIGMHPDAVGFPPDHPTMTTFLGVPVSAGEHVFGNLYLTDKPEGFTSEDEAIVETLAAVAGAAINATRLQRRLSELALVEDRERIARDLHDAVIQDLFAVGLTLQGLSLATEDETSAAKLESVVDRLDEAIGALRSFIFDLRSLDDSYVDPKRAFGQLVQRLTHPHPVETSVAVEDLGRLPSRHLDDALHIVREAVSNAVRHSGTDRIEVHVYRRDDTLTVSVVDYGRGFDVQTVERGMGLDNLQRRAERLGGKTQIDSVPGEGTQVTSTLPL